ncbi:hypothetical protein [Microlunatus speluncae]|uniref:hypothetical protein n=1 Tax=Microlunatus speluncae TaxID=2594267 RepID=UPI001266310F|nr:hypothetical protein [Microlunatus speluncae]
MISDEVAQVLPLRVIEYAITSPFFNVFGQDWSLAINCDWSLNRGDARLAGWEDEEFEVVIAALRGRSIVEIRIGEDLRDPVIRFDDGTELVVRADTHLDPWVLRAEGLSVVLVGAGPVADAPPPGPTF